MEKAILKTLIYANIFDYPLKAWEIHKWMIGARKCELPDVEVGLRRLLKKKNVIEKRGFYVLAGRLGLVKKRLEKVASSKQYLRDAKLICRLFRIIPWIKLVGISGNLTMNNAGVEDDIDLFVITGKKRLWITRFFLLAILSLLEKRRRKSDSRKNAAGKFCLNLLIEEDQLEQQRKDLYTAHEVLQMIPLWERNNMHGSFLSANEWVFRFLPNWASGMGQERLREVATGSSSNIVTGLEQIMRFLQLRYMGNPGHGERVSRYAAYFHPEDKQPWVLREYERQCRKYLNK